MINMSNNNSYSKEWITAVRGKMDKSTFGKQVVVYKKNGTVCASVHRNTIGNWESGKTSLPKDLETFLSIALIEYDKEHKEEASFNRNARYDHARQRLREMLGVELYCRNLHDALLISVCRGIITFQELIPLEKEFEADLKKEVIPNDLRDIYAIERNTIRIGEELVKISSVEELRECITLQYRNSFASSNRIIGARMMQVYKSRERYPGHISFHRAVANLAPNYRDSYVRMFTSSFISRRWMIDLCQHLCYSREETAVVLEAAHMAKLASDEQFEEPIQAYKNMPLISKLEIMLLLAIYMKENIEEDAEKLPPAVHLLESFSIYEHGENARKVLDRITDEEETLELDVSSLSERMMLYEKKKSEKELYKTYSSWLKYLNGESMSLRGEELLQQLSRKKTPGYDVLPPTLKVVSTVTNSQIASNLSAGKFKSLRYLVCMCYTVLKGEIFNGHLTEADLNAIQRSFAREEKDSAYIYRFISKMLVVFLGDQPLCQTEAGRYDVINDTSGKHKTALDMDIIQETLWESILYLKGKF